jgi:8-oxo-dGTP pyrophosphatase MutT (NUDIX family)
LTDLRSGITLPTGESYTLADLLRQEPNYYETPEWGFPKGRRDPHETDIQCAFRELWEETAFSVDELWKAINVAPFIEQFYGSNDIHYRHTYYLSQYVGTRNISYDILNSEMTREIGNIAWKSLDEALLLLRPENVEKRGILIQLATLLRNFLPIFKEQLIPTETQCRVLSANENTTEEQERYVFSSRTDTTQERSNSSIPKRFFGAR